MIARMVAENDPALGNAPTISSLALFNSVRSVDSLKKTKPGCCSLPTVSQNAAISGMVISVNGNGRGGTLE